MAAPSSPDPAPGGPGALHPLGRAVLRAMLGALAGLVLGAAVVAVLWFVTFARALAGEPGAGLPGFIAVDDDGRSVSTVLGPALLLAPLMLASLGAVLVPVLGCARDRRADRLASAGPAGGPR